ncbi:hypothetical protein ACFLQ5_01695 [Bacteroidota bacterium]
MRKLVILGVLSIILISACKKDNKIIEIVNEPTINYNPSTIGSYWIYDHYEIDEQGNEKLLTVTDSVMITGDTLINNHTYKVYKGTSLNQWNVLYMLKDSGDYVVDSDGMIFLSTSNYTDTLDKGKFGLMTYSFKMEQPAAAITVPAGSFNVINYQGTYNTVNPPTGVTYPRYRNNYYTDGIGRIGDSYFYYNNPKNYERRLVRYNIE